MRTRGGEGWGGQRTFMDRSHVLFLFLFFLFCSGGVKFCSSFYSGRAAIVATHRARPASRAASSVSIETGS